MRIDLNFRDYIYKYYFQSLMLCMQRFLLYLLVSVTIMVACNPVSRITTGDDAFEYKRYPLAVTLLQEEIEKTKFKDVEARKSFLVGESYRLMNQDVSSIRWYRSAYEISKNQVSLEAYAGAVLRAQQYTNAKKLYAKLIEDYGQNEAWDIAVKSCDAAKQWISEQNPNKYVITRAKFNSPFSDFSPVFYDDIIVFNSDRTESIGEEYHWTGNQFMDFYRTREESKLDKLLNKINSPFNEASITFNKDLTHAVYTQCGSDREDAIIESCKLIEASWSEREQNWTTFKMLSFCIDRINYGHPTFFNADRGIIFSSDDPEGIGGRDLWVTYKDDDSWATPILLPPGINTSADEKFPVMQGDTLFFASDGLIGMGGLDLYFSKFVSPDGWTPAVNLKPPINSGGDDFGFVFDPGFKEDPTTKMRFYISSNRKGSQSDDIYIFEEKKLKTSDTSDIKVRDFEIVIEGKVLEHIYEIPGDPNSRKMGTRPLPGAQVQIQNNDRFPVLIVEESGEFKYNLNEEGPYRFIAQNRGYLSNTQFVEVKLNSDEKEAGGKTYIVHIVLDPIVYNKEIVLENIYYDFDKWNIREDAEPSLEELADLLKANPDIKIELSSHTDCRGLEIYNAELSQRRAQSAVTYLTALGIDARRMRAVGYGEQRPAVVCDCESCSEDQHQANRRTAFTILK